VPVLYQCLKSRVTWSEGGDDRDSGRCERANGQPHYGRFSAPIFCHLRENEGQEGCSREEKLVMMVIFAFLTISKIQYKLRYSLLLGLSFSICRMKII
jgi:hypothetical protein